MIEIVEVAVMALVGTALLTLAVLVKIRHRDKNFESIYINAGTLLLTLSFTFFIFLSGQKISNDQTERAKFDYLRHSSSVALLQEVARSSRQRGIMTLFNKELSACSGANDISGLADIVQHVINIEIVADLYSSDNFKADQFIQDNQELLSRLGDNAVAPIATNAETLAMLRQLLTSVSHQAEAFNQYMENVNIAHPDTKFSDFRPALCFILQRMSQNVVQQSEVRGELYFNICVLQSVASLDGNGDFARYGAIVRDTSTGEPVNMFDLVDKNTAFFDDRKFHGERCYDVANMGKAREIKKDWRSFSWMEEQ